jgi:hypothetical protein
MAEATDRPADKVVTAAIPASPAPAGAKDDAPRVYSSVSLVAIIGFVLAALYAGFLSVAAPIALFNHTPMILPLWTLGFPLAAAAVCWAARSRIRNSEGALTGTRLTAWGVGLSAVAGLLYAAYYAGNYMAVTSQATKFTNEWMGYLKNDQIDQAFLYTLPPPRPADDAGLRDRLELEFDRTAGSRGPQLTAFRGSEVVRQFEEDGANADVQFLGVQGWDYEQSSYVVYLTYRVTTTCIVTDLMVTAVGVDENGERKWFAKDAHAIKDRTFTPEGQRMQVLTNQAREVGQLWLDKIVAGDWDEAYLETLPPQERESQRKDHATRLASSLSAVGLLGSPLGQGPLLIASSRASSPFAVFMAGGVVHYDPDKFWVGPKQSDKARQASQTAKADMVRALFGAARNDLPPMEMSRALPSYRHDGATFRVGIDMEISPGNQVVQAHMVLVGDFGPGEPAKDQWRIEALELVSSKSASLQPTRPGAPGQLANPILGQ